MRDKILNILSYLSSSLMQNKDLLYDADEIWESLHKQGYTEEEMESALAHIESISFRVPGPYWSGDIPVYRSYSSEEITRLTKKARGYLWTLKSQGVIDHALEDEIVARVMNLEKEAGVKEIRTVAALTIFGYEHRTDAYTELSGQASLRVN